MGDNIWLVSLVQKFFSLGKVLLTALFVFLQKRYLSHLNVYILGKSDIRLFEEKVGNIKNFLLKFIKFG